MSSSKQQQQQQSSSPPGGSSFRQQAPPSLSTTNNNMIDSDYDYSAANNANGGVTSPGASGTTIGNYNIRTTPTSAAVHYTSSAALRARRNLLMDNLDEDAFGMGQEGGGGGGDDVGGEEALLDLVQLEELHQEAERMKALGNKHMAAQEFTRAYNAYSAALQLSPVGPSSHVFLSNRAAALLSLKRYTAAATDARRAIALAPTFGKAHARLGQALYFQKLYAGAVAAYEDAIRFEPDNPVTVTYLEKAKAKQEKHLKKQQQQQQQQASDSKSGNGGGGNSKGDSANTSRGGGSVEDFSDSATHFTTAMQSITTTDHQQTSLITQFGGQRARTNPAVLKAAAQQSADKDDANQEQPLPPKQQQGQDQAESGPSTATTDANNNEDQEQTEDPDFHEALRIQQRANRYLAKKEYKAAIEEYTAALFLVPDDEQLSPDLHLGRAHALNGSRRHESARNDCILAIRLASPDNAAPAYSTLAKSLFYMKDYHGSVEAFYHCMELLQPQGESLGMFDKAYLQKAEAALEEQMASLNISGGERPPSKSPTVPKLPPPRFVPREEAIQKAPSIPSMPKQWQSAEKHLPTSPCALKCGDERQVIFFSEALGMKLNRGPDGMVRVLSVAPNTPASPVARSGDIEVGDIVREAAGVDIRRPITNVMWGDTVALIKMAPRPITLIVAKELSEVPPAVVEEQKRALSQQPMSPGRSIRQSHNLTADQLGPGNRSSFASGDEPVAESMAAKAAAATAAPALAPQQEISQVEEVSSSLIIADHDPATATASTPTTAPISTDDVVTAVPPAPYSTGETLGGPATKQEAVVVDDPPLLLPTVESEDEPKEVINVSDSDKPMEGATTTTPSDSSSKGQEPELVNSGAEENSGKVEAKEDWVAVDEDGAPRKEGAVDAAEKSSEQPEVGPLDANNSSTATSVMATKETSASAVVPEEHEQAITDADPDAMAGPIMENSRTALRQKEDRVLAGEVLFVSGSPAVYNGWDNLRWMSYSGSRKILFCESVYRLVDVKQKVLFWNNAGHNFAQRTLAIYEEPRLILVLRRPSGVEEMSSLLCLPTGAELAECERKMDNYWVVESVVDPEMGKLRLSELTTSTSQVIAQDGPMDARKSSCFELISPAESIFLSAVRVRNETKRKERSFTDSGAFLETSAVETAITKALCAAHKKGDDIGMWEADIAWKHQIILGTLHAYVLSRNAEALESAMERARKKMPTEDRTPDNPNFLPDRIINALDDHSRTPLYYACMSRMNAAVASLIAAGATADFRSEPHGLTPAHVCAMNLDDKSLSVVLAANQSSNGRSCRPDPNALDAFGHTPMYLACVKGKTVRGDSDSASLERCLMALEAWGGKMLIDLPRPIQHPLNVLACEFRAEDVSIVLDHVKSRYPLKSSTSFDQPGAMTVSVSALYQYPLHSAMISFLKRVQSLPQKKKKNEVPDGALLQTTKVLLEHGFEPNERIDQIECPSGVDLGNFIGHSPLQILALACLELDRVSDETELRKSWMSVITQTSELLVTNGARVSLDSPPEQRPHVASRCSSSVDCESSSSVHSQSSQRGSLKIDSNARSLALLGGKELLDAARKTWCDEKPVAAISGLIPERDDSAGIDDSNEAGGSSDKSCAICWKSFGALVNRKHKCRVSWRYVCDDCSTKRVIHGGKEVRLSDGQFLFARAAVSMEARERSRAKAEQEKIQSVRAAQPVAAAPKDLAAVRLARLEAEEEANRDSLFGGVLEQATNFVFGDESAEGESASRNTSTQVEGLSAQLGETRNALLERGDKLSTLNEKSAQMVNASEDFAKMAKELRKQSESNWFW